MTIDDGIELLIDELDEAFAHLREIHENNNYLNPDSDDYRIAMEWFNGLSKQLFEAKNMRWEMKRLKRQRDERKEI